MKAPNDRQIDEWVEWAIQLGKDAPRIGRQLKAVNRRNRERNVIDGYPSSTTGGGRGGAELTSVESAAARLTDRDAPPLRDPVNDAAENIFGHAWESRDHARAMTRGIDNLNAAGGLETDDWCEAFLQIGEQVPGDHYGNVGGRLPVARRLSKQAYQFVRDNGRMPTDEELRWQNQHGRWRVRNTA